MPTIAPFEIWKVEAAGFGVDHYFVIISNNERCQNKAQFNGLACYTKRGAAQKTDVVINGADGMDGLSVVDCGIFYVLNKQNFRSKKGSVTAERQEQIRRKIREVLRLG